MVAKLKKKTATKKRIVKTPKAGAPRTAKTKRAAKK